MKVSDDSNEEKPSRDFKNVLSNASNNHQMYSPPTSVDCVLTTVVPLAGSGQDGGVEAPVEAGVKSLQLPVGEEAGGACQSGERVV